MDQSCVKLLQHFTAVILSRVSVSRKFHLVPQFVKQAKTHVYSKAQWKGQMCRRLLKQKRETRQCQIYVEGPA